LNDALNTLLGLDGLRFGDDGAGLGWAHPVPAWGWLLIVLAAVFVSAWSYSRLEGPRVARTVLACVRALMLLVLAVAASGPRLERERTEIERDRLAVLIDRSASLGISDGGAGSRDEELRGLLESTRATWSAIAEEKEIDWIGFGGAAVPLATGTPTPPDGLPPADLPRTAIGAALETAVRRASGRPLSGVVVLSDGRSADTLPSGVLADLRSERVPVHVVPVGSPERAAEFAVRSAEAPTVAFVDDTVPVTVRFDHTGIGVDRAGRFEIVDDATGLVLEAGGVTEAQLEAGEATLVVETEQSGPQRWTVRYVPEGPDLSAENNTASLALRLVDEPIRVLYVDGSPRWEQRFLKSLLIREDSVDSSCLLLAVNRRFQQEGDTVLTSLPVTSEDWAPFDVVVIGDLRPELLGPRALEQIRSLVGEQAGGLLWLAGPSATPAAWGDTELTDLLPIAPGPDAGGGQARPTLWDQPVVIRPTPAAERAGLFAGLLGAEPGGVTDPDAGWSGLRWALRPGLETIKASAEVLADGVPASGSAEGARPLVLTMRYGAGRVALVGTDEIWRWRYGQGEAPTERFWLPLLRSLARPRLSTIGRAASLEISPSIAGVGDRVSVRVIVTDQSIAEIAPRELEARVLLTDVAGGRRPAGTVRLTREPGPPSGRTVFEGSLPALRPGSFLIEVAADALAGLPLDGRLEVVSDEDELRNPQTDHGVLADLAERTGGRVLDAETIGELPDILPNRRVVVPLRPELETLWDTPLVLGLLLGLLTLEWVWRRLIRLS
jgi:hypothetical protein